MSERMEGPEKRGHRNSPEREASRVRVEPEPVLPTSALIINEMEQHYFRPGLPTSEYAAVRDCATLLNAANYVILRGSDDFSNNRFNDSGKLVNSRREAGVYGENGETLKEAGS